MNYDPNKPLRQQLDEAGIRSQDLDDLVHQEASSLASSTNNNGMSSQLEFLTARMEEADIFEMAFTSMEDRIESDRRDEKRGLYPDTPTRIELPPPKPARDNLDGILDVGDRVEVLVGAWKGSTGEVRRHIIENGALDVGLADGLRVSFYPDELRKLPNPQTPSEASHD